MKDQAPKVAFNYELYFPCPPSPKISLKHHLLTMYLSSSRCKKDLEIRNFVFAGEFEVSQQCGKSPMQVKLLLANLADIQLLEGRRVLSQYIPQ